MVEKSSIGRIRTLILIIEDDQGIRESTADILDIAGYDTIQAENGRLGVATARDRLPDLILCDIMMPELDGYGVLNELRRNPRTAVIPFIFLTAKSEITDIRAGMLSGADDYITKPFDPDILLETIRMRLSKRAQQTQAMEDLRFSLARSVPHEFRTPLNAIIGFSQILVMSMEGGDMPSKEELHEYLTLINNAGERLLNLVEKYTLYAEISSLTALNSEITRQHTSPAKLAHIEQTLHAIVFRNKRTADFESSLQPATLEISDFLLEKALIQLVENACKFSAPGTPVTVRGFCAGNEYRIEIADKGRGMTQEEISSIAAYLQFNREKFEQQGAGLGLAIVQRIAACCSIALEIESKPGVGSRFRLNIPCKELPA